MVLPAAGTKGAAAMKSIGETTVAAGGSEPAKLAPATAGASLAFAAGATRTAGDGFNGAGVTGATVTTTEGAVCPSDACG